MLLKKICMYGLFFLSQGILGSGHDDESNVISRVPQIPAPLNPISLWTDLEKEIVNPVVIERNLGIVCRTTRESFGYEFPSFERDQDTITRLYKRLEIAREVERETRRIKKEQEKHAALQSRPADDVLDEPYQSQLARSAPVSVDVSMSDLQLDEEASPADVSMSDLQLDEETGRVIEFQPPIVPLQERKRNRRRRPRPKNMNAEIAAQVLRYQYQLPPEQHLPMQQQHHGRQLPTSIIFSDPCASVADIVAKIYAGHQTGAQQPRAGQGAQMSAGVSLAQVAHQRAEEQRASGLTAYELLQKKINKGQLK